MWRIAESVRPEGVGSALVVTAAIVSLVFLLLGRPQDWWKAVPAILFVLVTGSWLLAASLAEVPAIRWWAVGVVALGGLGAHLAVGRRVHDDQAPLANRRPWPAWLYLSAAGAIAAWFLFHQLGDYSGRLMVWEPAVLNGFGDSLREGVGVGTNAWHMLHWSEGLVSNGDESFLYGTATYALLNWVGVSVTSLRAASAVLAWLCVPAVFWGARRLGGAFVSTAGAVLLACSVPLVYYGRYGTSLAGTLLGVVVALGCCWFFLDERADRWWGGLLCAVALFAATLGYSPARVVVLALFGVVVGSLAARWRRVRRGQLVGIVLFVVFLGSAWFLQVRSHATERFLSARGEQFLTMMKQPEVLQEYLGRPISPGTVTTYDRVELIGRLLGRRIPEYLSLLGRPLMGAATVGQVLGSDPPALPLFYGPLLPFLVWGIAISVLRLGSLQHLTMVVWFVLGSAPLLLTTRVDAHRGFLLLVPLTFWVAVGLREGASVMRFADVPPWWQHTIAVGLVVTAILANLTALYDPTQAPHLAGRVLGEEIDSLHGPVVLGATIDPLDVGEANLTLLERMRREPADRGGLLHEGILRALQNCPSPPAHWIDDLKQAFVGGTLILAPAESFEATGGELKRRGFRLAEGGTAGARFLVLSQPLISAGSPIGPASGGQAAAATPAPPFVRLRSGPEVFLNALKPESVEFGFAPPRPNRNWSGGKLMLGGVEYTEGIGTHAWCRMTYQVPDTAIAFQALVGLDDDARACSVALVSFELQDERGQVLFDTGLIGPATPPEVMYVPLAGPRSVTLVVTEGGNGRDCDHADWVEPAFLLKRPPVQPSHTEK